MAKKAIDLVAENVNRLVSQAGLSNAALEKKAGGRLTRSTVDRVRRAEGSPGIESVSEIARTFGLELWQLCVENLDPLYPPKLMGASLGEESADSETESMLLSRFRDLSPAFQQLVLNDVERYLEAEHQTRHKKGAPAKRSA